VLHFLAHEGLLENGLKVRPLCLPDIFFEHDKPEKQIELAGLTAKGIVSSVLAALGQSARSGSVRA